MSRTPLPYSTGDVSALARSLRNQLTGRSEPPGHVELLNILARAAGWRNFQHFKAQSTAHDRLMREPTLQDASLPEPAVDHVKLRKIARCFDGHGTFIRWPGKVSERLPCLWVMWSRLPADRVMTEVEVNRFLTQNHTFGDYALLRRELCDLGLLVRTTDGREYRRIERRPPADALALIRHLKLRTAGRLAAVELTG